MKEKRIKELTAQLNDYAYRYYVLDAPVVSDKDYDKLFDELLALEAETGFVLPDSPSKRVGGEPLSGFKKYAHTNRLYSLDKVKDAAGLAAWRERVSERLASENVRESIEFTVEYKYDGLTLSLIYDGGLLVTAATRGDGVTGEDVTEQVKTIKSVPLAIPYKGRAEVQGEGIMRLSALEKYNKTAEVPLKNARNAAAGAIRNLDPKVTASRNLDVIFYNAACEGEFDTQSGAREFLKRNKFKVGDDFLCSADFDKIAARIEDINDRRSMLDYLIDGAVIKADAFRYREILGFTDRFPRWAAAYKFEAEEATSVILSVDWNVGRSGKITPIARLEPVELAGVTVSNATLNNAEDIKRKNVSINSRVFLRRSNDVIPEILGLAEEFEDSRPIETPTVCPGCGGAVKDVGPNIFCASPEGCRPKITARLSHYCGKDAMDIEGVSDKTAETLYDNLGVSDPAALYRMTREELLTLEGFKEKKADKTLAGLEKSKSAPLARFIYALGIPNVGAVAARSLAEKFKGFTALRGAKQRELTKTPEIGTLTAEGIRAYFADEKNARMIDGLFAAGVNPVYEVKVTAAPDPFFADKKFVLTGTLAGLPRSKAAALIEERGGRVGETVSRGIDYLIVGTDAGAKLEKAKKQGVAILTEEEFLGKL